MADQTKCRHCGYPIERLPGSAGGWWHPWPPDPEYQSHWKVQVPLPPSGRRSYLYSCQDVPVYGSVAEPVEADQR